MTKLTDNYSKVLALMVAVAGSLVLLLNVAPIALAQPDRADKELPERGVVADAPVKTFYSSRLVRKAEEEGSVRVTVGLRTDFEPEGRLSKPQVADQREDIDGARAGLRSDLGTLEYRTVRQFETIPYLALELSPEALEAVQRSPHVTMIREDRPVSFTLAESTPIVQAPEMWSMGYAGSGQTVAVIDSGVDPSHSFLAGKVVDEACYSVGNDCPNNSTSQLGPGSGVPCALNGCDHGTHVAGIAAGAGSNFSGVARGANIMSIQVSSEYTGAANCPSPGPDPCAKPNHFDVVKGLERVFLLRGSRDFSSVSVSIGGGDYSGDCDAQFPDYKAQIDNLKSVGIATVIASGNNNNTDGIGAPACVSSAVSVGATTDADQVASPSDWGTGVGSNSSPSLDLLAPGTGILSSGDGPGNEPFVSKSGTSMAAPHVAGAWALLQQQEPSATVDEILTALKNSGKPVTDTRVPGGVTKPRIEIAHALALLSPLANDDFANAQVITGRTPSAFEPTNAGATREPGEPDHLPSSSGSIGERSLWFSWKAPSNGRVTIDTCQSGLDTVLAVYTGSSVNALSQKASDNDSCTSPNQAGSKVTIDAIANTTYKIAVSGYSSASEGNFVVKANYVAPANDDFANAETMIGGTHVSTSGKNFEATREPGEPDHVPFVTSRLGERSVWYSWTAPATGEVTMNTCLLTSFNTHLAVYTGGSLAGLIQEAQDDDSCPDGQFSNGLAGKVTFEVTGGTTYKIAVTGYNADHDGTFRLGVDYTNPANDYFTDAQAIIGANASVDGTTIGATRQSGEPDHLPSSGSFGQESVWYGWTAPASGPVTLDTCTSSFNTALAVYTGDVLSSLSQTVTDNDSCESPNAQGAKLTFDAAAGTTYKIAVASGSGFDRGTFTLKLSGDQTSPKVQSISPANKATGVGLSANVKAAFSEDMLINSVNAKTFKLFEKGSTTRVAATVSYDAATHRATLDPTNALKKGVAYKAVVSTGAEDLAGNNLDQKPNLAGLQPKVWSFKARS